VPSHLQDRKHKRQIGSILQIGAPLPQVLVINAHIQAVPECPESTGDPIAESHGPCIHGAREQLPLLELCKKNPPGSPLPIKEMQALLVEELKIAWRGCSRRVHAENRPG
jgi:hypothetical protein